MSVPSDLVLYSLVKEEIYKIQPMHSAYRSGRIVKTYKRIFSQIYGDQYNPYQKSRPPKNTGLGRWFDEEWLNQRGEVGYKYRDDVYRPTRRISKATPVTFKELSPRQIQRAMREKQKLGRVKKFQK